MSQKEYNRIRISLAPFIRLMLAISLLGLLASCGGGGNTGEITVQELPTVTVDKLDTESQQKIANGSSIEKIVGFVKNQYIVYTPNKTETEAKQLISDLSEIKLLASYSSYLLIEIDENKVTALNQLETLKTMDGVRAVFQRQYVGKDAQLTHKLPNDGQNYTDAGTNWHLEYINAPAAWDITTGDDKISIGVMDCGFFKDHSDLINRIESSLSYRECAHGTESAGVIVAEANDNSNSTGINWQSKAILANYGKDGEFGADSTISSIRTMNSYRLLVNNSKIRVINNSWGPISQCDRDSQGNNIFSNCPTTSQSYAGYDGLRPIIEDSTNILHVFSAGNDGRNADTQNGVVHLIKTGGVYSLNKLPHVLVVAAIGQDGKLVNYSNYGDTIDIAAPTEFQAPYDGTGATSRMNLKFDGTSASAPVISGVASLILSVNPKLTASEVKNILITTSDRFATQRYTSTGSVEYLSTPIPIVNAEKAVRAALETLSKPTATISIITPTPTAGSGVIFEPNITASPNGAVTEYEWDFGDGTIQMGTPSQINHTYTSGGTYTVKLKIKDVKGVTNTTTVTVTVAGVSVPAVTSISPITATAGEVTTFAVAGTNLSTSRQLDITFNGCANIAVTLKSANLHKFTCTPQASGTITADIRSTAGGTVLKSQQVTVTPVASTNLLLGSTVSDSCFNCPNEYWGNPNNITDGNMESGRNLGMQSGTFHIFLTNPKTIDRLRLLPAMTPNGLVYYEIQTSTDPTGAVGTWTSHGGEKSSEWANNTWFDFTLNANTQNVRVIKVNVTYTPSWLAFFEIEAYAP
jgi:hypothetical protein